jgi:hypothetical protein
MSIDTVLGIIGTILGVIGLITGYIFYRKSLKVKEPYYSIWSNNLIQDNVTSMSGLEVSFKGKKVDNLTVSKILFWNDGSDTIEKGDIVSTDPLRIESKYRILDAAIIKTNNPSNQVSVLLEKGGSSAKVTFDYLDKNNGALIQIIHTGKSSKDISITGKLKGSVIRFYLSKNGRATEVITFLLGIMFIAFFVTVFLQSTFDLAAGWLISIGSLLALLFILYISGITKKLNRLIPNRLPNDFKDAFE